LNLPTFYIDGGSVGNEQKDLPRRARIAIVHKASLSEREHPSQSRVFSEEIGDKTNNEAEYQALLRLLTLITKEWTGNDGKMLPGVGTVRILADSDLLVNQVNGVWKVKEERLRRLWEQAKKTINAAGSISLEWVPREDNYAGLWLEGKWKGKRVQAEQLLKS
jgi:ribonuclease HI